MKSAKHRAEMAARKARRATRSDRQLQRQVNRIAMNEYVKRIMHDEKMRLVAAGTVVGPEMTGAMKAAAEAERAALEHKALEHKTTTGTTSLGLGDLAQPNSVTPEDEDEEA